MTFAELKTEVFRRLNENATTPVFWTEADVELAINEGYEELSDATEWFEEYFVLKTQSNLLYYDLRTLLPETFLAPKRLYNQATSEWLSPVTLRDLDFHTTRQWETMEGEPSNYLMRGLWYLGLNPACSVDDRKIKMFYTAIPQSMTEDTDEPGFPQEMHKYLVEYALYDLFAQDGETKKAVKHWKEYLAGEKMLKDFVQKRLSLDRVAHV
jgi:hypothetical protein